MKKTKLSVSIYSTLIALGFHLFTASPMTTNDHISAQQSSTIVQKNEPQATTIENNMLMSRLIESTLRFAGAMANEDFETAATTIHSNATMDESTSSIAFANEVTITVDDFANFSLTNFELLSYDETNRMVSLLIDNKQYNFKFAVDNKKETFFKIIAVEKQA
ncbi:MAG: hypothetical protein ABS882_03405 [Lysinibacillus sp.]